MIFIVLWTDGRVMGLSVSRQLSGYGFLVLVVPFLCITVRKSVKFIESVLIILRGMIMKKPIDSVIMRR